MRLSLSTQRRRNDADRGFTLVETAIALAALSGLCLAALPLVVAQSRALSGAIRLAADAARVAEFESSIRRAVARVRIPHWWTTLEVAPDADGAVCLPCLDGHQAKEMEIRWLSGELRCTTGGNVLARLRCTEARMDMVHDLVGRLIGIEIMIRLGDSRDVRIVAPLGAIAAGGVP
jgi:prepilin-type N-terminal cleavage/methylation domain-containing protein